MSTTATTMMRSKTHTQTHKHSHTHTTFKTLVCDTLVIQQGGEEEKEEGKEREER